MKKIVFLIIAISICFSVNVIAGEAYLKGKISNITSVKSGLLIMLDTGVPGNCEGASYNWIRVNQENTAIGINGVRSN